MENMYSDAGVYKVNWSRTQMCTWQIMTQISTVGRGRAQRGPQEIQFLLLLNTQHTYFLVNKLQEFGVGSR